MAGKLKSACQNLYLRLKQQSHWSLFLKAVIFAAVLYLAAWSDFRIISSIFFIIAAVVLYARPIFSGYQIWRAFTVLLVVAILGMKIVSGTALFFPAPLAFAFIFYLILGIKDYLFIKRSRIYYIAALLLFYSIFIIFFLADKSDWFAFKYGAVVLASYFLFWEWLGIITSFSFPKREMVISSAAALATGQILLATAFLPIGFLSAANFMLLFVFILNEFILKHFMGGISREFLIKRLILFFLLAGLIFWTSGWALNF
ncbi:MAG: hypothetical protein A3B92_00625 [Candidatus Harrisonbacteria bacterium RIFCSPHIGHO2_02_FULL_42_16]|uniref:Uncharacterized protein n=1 Tax=Candidatus Harrisonbacteria bacterium RIFCSPHIGHO2_02_FULL_42_16 TaxID=1798404 RepID=A0A1G1ZJJ1_9BACT|nr:MAG: hypothetical protein A3B92_00625 [Candidatus Harrisonbacteria bacterium RIFCSPHIGHO2_02_FULL_42_16]